MASSIKINNVTIKQPSKFGFSIMDLDSEESVRVADGTMQRDRITQKRKLSLEFPPMTLTETATVLNAVNPVEFPVFYPDMLSGTWQTRTFYCGNRDNIEYLNLNTEMSLGLKFDLIEK